MNYIKSSPSSSRGTWTAVQFSWMHTKRCFTKLSNSPVEAQSHSSGKSLESYIICHVLEFGSYFTFIWFLFYLRLYFVKLSLSVLVDLSVSMMLH